ncbi:hypothetical protein SPICUR_07595 [Spiribacter curvatus]|uniref:DUF721 domain-containing protein n=1 Tax=Spiribacter curvatus TaxID=1335757 RepID=U5T4L0_9GAMM|nr:DciA family protein [Spiribacter curvatus]AGY92479.1 hypothetical protein SPICUR_07595 [Spiribacter curvatus]
MSERKGGGPGRLQGVLRRSTNDIAAIRRQTALLEQATRTLNASLPPRLHGHWQVAALSADALVITAESSVWATPLRAYQSGLLEAATALISVQPKRLQIRLAAPAPAKPPRESVMLSAGAAQHLESAARGMDDSRLAASLRRLASRRHERSSGHR